MASDWRVVYLRALGAKPTSAALDFLAKWQPYEGGHTKNNATYNYLNTTKRMPGSHGINSVGVQAYGSLAQGAQAFARTLLGNPNYASLVSFLKTGQGDPSPGLQTWVSGKPNGNPTYAAKVLGSTPQVPTQSSAPAGGPIPLTSPDVVGKVQEQARSSLTDIATGRRSATEGLTDIADLVKTLHASAPRIDIPTRAQGGSELESQAANLVRKYLGIKYTWGGTDAKTGFDCSGLIQTVWRELGVKIPRVTYDQWKAGKPVSAANLKPGDAVFFHMGPQGPEHEGMYIGNGKFIEAPRTGLNVRISDLAGRTDFVGARRFA